MKLFVIIIALAFNVALRQAQAGGAGTGAEGGVQVGGCGNVGASGDASASAGGAEGLAGGSADASVNYSDSTPAGYTYVIKARRTENTIAPGYPIVYMYYQVTPTQSITYYTAVGPDNPYLIEAYLTVNDEIVFANDDSHYLNACDNFDDGTWQYVIVEIVKKGIIPDGSCSVDKGNYTAYQDIDPITMNSPEMIKCGDYSLIFNAFVGEVWALQLEYSFAIPDDGNCDSS